MPWAEYEYGGPTTCVVPPELLVHGCPTMVHELSVNAPEREATLRLTYDDAGRLVRWTSTFPRTGELLEDATVSYDDEGRPVRIARAPGWSSDAWYGWTQTADTTFTWSDHEVVLERGMFRVVFQLDAAGRRTHHDVEYSGQATYRADWRYDGDRLDRIEETAVVTGGTQTVYRYAYDCP
ncbi:MAG: hypothetical protein J0L92_34070 [Deltaproteobacteria bacterium]|nr:hypothetical protein [Deltaproteobacteria bacterium]